VYFIVDTTLYQLDAATGAIINTLKFDNAANVQVLQAIDIAPDDNHLIVGGGKSHSQAYWAIVDTNTLLPVHQALQAGGIVGDVKYVSNTDYIIDHSTEGDSLYREVLERYSGAALVWTRRIQLNDGSATY